MPNFAIVGMEALVGPLQGPVSGGDDYRRTTLTSFAPTCG